MTSASVTLNFNQPTTYLTFFFQRQQNIDNNYWDDWSGNTAGSDFIDTATLKLNSQALHQAQKALWLRLVNPADHGGYSPDKYFYTIPFSLDVNEFRQANEEYNPSGSMNFSRIDTVTIDVVGDSTTTEGGYTQVAHGRNYNVGKVAAGMFGLYYA
jgi:hypothetical protein